MTLYIIAYAIVLLDIIAFVCFLIFRVKIGAKYVVFMRTWDQSNQKFVDHSFLSAKTYTLNKAKVLLDQHNAESPSLSMGIKEIKTGEVIVHPGNKLRDNILALWYSFPGLSEEFIQVYVDTRTGPRQEYEPLPEPQGETSKENHESR